METRTKAACRSGVSKEIDDAAVMLCQPDIARNVAAAITEACIREFWPDDLDAKSLFPEIRHILESNVALQEFLDQVRNASGNPEDNLRLACARFIRSAAALHQIRSGAKDSQPLRP